MITGLFIPTKEAPPFTLLQLTPLLTERFTLWVAEYKISLFDCAITNGALKQAFSVLDELLRTALKLLPLLVER